MRTRVLGTLLATVLSGAASLAHAATEPGALKLEKGKHVATLVVQTQTAGSQQYGSQYGEKQQTEQFEQKQQQTEQLGQNEQGGASQQNQAPAPSMGSQACPPGQGASASAEAQAGAPTAENVIVHSQVNFATDSADLDDGSRKSLQEVASALRDAPDASLRIEGHTDSTGKSAGNDKLAEERASAVRDFLVQQGVDQGRIQVEGRGASDPLASNDTAEGRAMNRRADVSTARGGGE